MEKKKKIGAGLAAYFQALCQEAGLSPKKRFGQNFLLDEDIYERMADYGELQPGETVLEVGPGLGELTKRLARRAKEVLAVEYDEDLARILPGIMKKEGVENVQVLQSDILLLEKDRLYDKIVANLPYNISAKFLSQYLAERRRPKLMVLLLQKEVVERICAGPGQMSLLSLSVQYFALPEQLDKVPARSFWPAPKVDSSIVRLRTKNDLPDLGGKSERDFFRLARIGFSAKRKMLKNNLASGFHISELAAREHLLEAGLKEKARAQELSLLDWIRLLGTFS
jgi:16S rRNA (adenine1518-N6/adenine1519-N6)-dimethyltransferase